jgi:ABC-type bacteriocin/lantibiotic exporter with double-glycine peptidase domain
VYRDPATGARIKVNKDTSKRIQGQALYFYKPLPTRPLSVRDLAAFIFSSFDVHDYLLVLVAAVVATLVGMLPAWANQVMFSVVVPSGQEALIAPIASLLVGVSVSTVLIDICRNLVTQRLSIKAEVMSESAAFSRLLSLPTGFFKEHSGGELGTRVSQISMLVEQLASLLLGSGLTTVLSLA